MTTIGNTKGLPSELLDAVNPKKKDAQSTAAAAQDRFMTLLVTQMKNQDPLNPLDNAQVTSQLAQLSTVTGIDKLNATLEALQGSYQASQSMQATGMIGHNVLVPGAQVQLAEGKARFGVELAQPADKVTVKILDAGGGVVRTMDLGAQQVGMKAVEWDGKTDSGTAAKDGSYRFEIAATRGADKLSAVALTQGKVNSVSTGAQGVKLNINGMEPVNVGDVRQIL